MSNQKTLVRLVNMAPRHDSAVWVKHRKHGKRRISEGRFIDEGLGINLPLDPKMARDGGKTIWIDASKGIQIDYDGVGRWVGIDGRYTYASQVKKDGNDLRARGKDLTQYLWPAIVALGLFLATIVAITLLAGG